MEDIPTESNRVWGTRSFSSSLCVTPVVPPEPFFLSHRRRRCSDELGRDYRKLSSYLFGVKWKDCWEGMTLSVGKLNEQDSVLERSFFSDGHVIIIYEGH